MFSTGRNRTKILKVTDVSISSILKTMIPAIVQRLWIFGSMYLPQILVQFFQLTMCSSHFQEFFWILVTVSIVLLISLPKSKKKKSKLYKKDFDEINFISF